jgi:hypothetical protein
MSAQARGPEQTAVGALNGAEADQVETKAAEQDHALATARCAQSFGMNGRLEAEKISAGG